MDHAVLSIIRSIARRKSGCWGSGVVHWVRTLPSSSLQDREAVYCPHKRVAWLLVIIFWSYRTSPKGPGRYQHSHLLLSPPRCLSQNFCEWVSLRHISDCTCSASVTSCMEKGERGTRILANDVYCNCSCQKTFRSKKASYFWSIFTMTGTPLHTIVWTETSLLNQHGPYPKQFSCSHLESVTHSMSELR